MVFNRKQYADGYSDLKRQTILISNYRVYRFWWKYKTWLIKWQKLDSTYGMYMVNCKVINLMVF